MDNTADLGIKVRLLLDPKQFETQLSQVSLNLQKGLGNVSLSIDTKKIDQQLKKFDSKRNFGSVNAASNTNVAQLQLDSLKSEIANIHKSVLVANTTFKTGLDTLVNTVKIPLIDIKSNIAEGFINVSKVLEDTLPKLLPGFGSKLLFLIAPLSKVFTGLFESIGKPLGVSIGSIISNILESNIKSSFGSFDLLATKVGQSLSSGLAVVTAKVSSLTSQLPSEITNSIDGLLQKINLKPTVLELSTAQQQTTQKETLRQAKAYSESIPEANRLKKEGKVARKELVEVDNSIANIRSVLTKIQVSLTETTDVNKIQELESLYTKSLNSLNQYNQRREALMKVSEKGLLFEDRNVRNAEVQRLKSQQRPILAQGKVATGVIETEMAQVEADLKAKEESFNTFAKTQINFGTEINRLITVLAKSPLTKTELNELAQIKAQLEKGGLSETQTSSIKQTLSSKFSISEAGINAEREVLIEDVKKEYREKLIENNTALKNAVEAQKTATKELEDLIAIYERIQDAPNLGLAFESKQVKQSELKSIQTQQKSLIGQGKVATGVIETEMAQVEADLKAKEESFNTFAKTQINFGTEINRLITVLAKSPLTKTELNELAQIKAQLEKGGLSETQTSSIKQTLSSKFSISEAGINAEREVLIEDVKKEYREKLIENNDSLSNAISAQDHATKELERLDNLYQEIESSIDVDAFVKSNKAQLDQAGINIPEYTGTKLADKTPQSVKQLDTLFKTVLERVASASGVSLEGRELPKLNLKEAASQGAGGSFDSATKDVRFSNEVLSKALKGDLEDFVSILTHELRHYLQKEFGKDLPKVEVTLEEVKAILDQVEYSTKNFKKQVESTNLPKAKKSELIEAVSSKEIDAYTFQSTKGDAITKDILKETAAIQQIKEVKDSLSQVESFFEITQNKAVEYARKLKSIDVNESLNALTQFSQSIKDIKEGLKSVNASIYLDNFENASSILSETKTALFSLIDDVQTRSKALNPLLYSKTLDDTKQAVQSLDQELSKIPEFIQKTRATIGSGEIESKTYDKAAIDASWEPSLAPASQLDFDKEYKRIRTILSSFTVAELEDIALELSAGKLKAKSKAGKISQILNKYQNNLYYLAENLPEKLSNELAGVAQDLSKLSITDAKVELKDIVLNLKEQVKDIKKGVPLNVEEVVNSLKDIKKVLTLAQQLSSDKKLSKVLGGYRTVLSNLESELNFNENIDATQKAVSDLWQSEKVGASVTQPVRLFQASEGADLGLEKFNDVIGGTDTLLAHIARLVAQLSDYTGEIKLPSVIQSDLPDDMKASYRPEDNTIELSQEAYTQLKEGVLNADTVASLVHEIRHALQLEFGELDLEDAIKKPLLTPVQEEIDKVESAALASVKASAQSVEEASKLIQLERDAYTFQLRMTQEILNSLKTFQPASVPLNDLEQRMRPGDYVLEADDITLELKNIEHFLTKNLDLSIIQKLPISELLKLPEQIYKSVIASQAVSINSLQDAVIEQFTVSAAETQTPSRATSLSIQAGEQLDLLSEGIQEKDFTAIRKALVELKTLFREVGLDSATFEELAGGALDDVERSIVRVGDTVGGVSDTIGNFVPPEFGLSLESAKEAVFEFIAGMTFLAAADFLSEKLQEIAESTFEVTQKFNDLQRLLDYGFGDGEAALDKMYAMSQRLGSSFEDTAAGFSSFTSAIKGTSVESKSLEIYADLAETFSAMNLSQADTEGAFNAITQMASKGTVSMEELRQQLGERVPQSMQAMTKAVQDMVDDGLIPVENLNKSLVGASVEVREAYKVTSGDMIKYVSSGLLNSLDALPYFSKRLKEGLEVPESTFTKSINRIENAIIQLQRGIGEIVLPFAAKSLDNFSKIMQYLGDNVTLVANLFKGAFVLAVGLAGLALISFTKSITAANTSLLLLNANVTGLSSQLANLAIFSKVAAWFATASAGATGFAGALNILGAGFAAVISKVSAALIANPVMAIVAAGALLATVAAPAARMFANALAGTSKAAIQLSDDLGNIGNNFDKLQAKFANGGILDESEIKAEQQRLEGLAGGAEKLNKLLEQRETNPEALSVENRLIAEQAFLLEYLNKQNEARIKVTKEVEQYLLKFGTTQKDIAESQIETELELLELVAKGVISKEDADNKIAANEFKAAKKRLELNQAVVKKIEEDMNNDVVVSTEIAEARQEVLSNAEDAILEDRRNVAELTIQLQEETVQREIDLTNEKLDTLEKQYRQAELSRKLLARQAFIEGTLDIEAEEKKRLKNRETLLREQFKLEKAEIAKLNALLEQGVNDNQRAEIEAELLQSMERQVEIMAELASLELERQAELQRQVDLKAELIQGDIDEINTKSELVQIAAELASIQSDLDNARSEALQAQYSLALAYSDVEQSRIQYELDAVELLKNVDKDRSDIIARRLGFESDGLKNAIELSRERENQEQHLQTLKENQLKVQQNAERQQLEADKSQLKYTIEQERYQIQALKLEQEIAKMKASQALSAAKANMAIAMSSGDTQAAAQAELEILQARRELDLINSNTIAKQEQSFRETSKAQSEILNEREAILDVTHEQQQVELELSYIAQQRADALRIEQQLLEESVVARSLAREEALLELKHGTESQQRIAESITSQHELNDLQDTYNKQLEYVESLQASGVNNANEELILTRETNKLGQNRLDLLNAELQLKSDIEDAEKVSKDLIVQSASLALKYGTEETKLAADLLESKQQLNDVQAEYSEQLEFVNELESQGLLNATDELSLIESRNDLQRLGLELLQAEYDVEEKLANEVAQQREKALQRQVDILEQRKTLIEAEAGLAAAQANLKTAKLEGSIIDVDRSEQLGDITSSEADQRRAEIQLKILDAEKEAMVAQQESDLKRLEIEQQIEIMRLRATQAEAEVVRARAEVSLAESQAALGRARESGDADAITAAEAAIEASQNGIDAAQSQVELIDEQIEATLELQDIQRETIETQQKADEQRIKNRERELELALEIAAAQRDSDQGQDTNDGFRVSGGGVSAGNTYTVGEQGTELFKGADGSTKLLGLNGQQAFTPKVPGKIISNHALEQVIAANVMRSDQAVVDAIQRGFKSSGTDFARLAGVLANRTQKPVVVNNYGSGNKPTFDANRAKLARL